MFLLSALNYAYFPPSLAPEPGQRRGTEKGKRFALIVSTERTFFFVWFERLGAELWKLVLDGLIARCQSWLGVLRLAFHGFQLGGAPREHLPNWWIFLANQSLLFWVDSILSHHDLPSRRFPLFLGAGTRPPLCCQISNGPAPSWRCLWGTQIRGSTQPCTQGSNVHLATSYLCQRQGARGCT